MINMGVINYKNWAMAPCTKNPFLAMHDDHSCSYWIRSESLILKDNPMIGCGWYTCASFLDEDFGWGFNKILLSLIQGPRSEISSPTDTVEGGSQNDKVIEDGAAAKEDDVGDSDGPAEENIDAEDFDGMGSDDSNGGGGSEEGSDDDDEDDDFTIEEEEDEVEEVEDEDEDDDLLEAIDATESDDDGKEQAEAKEKEEKNKSSETKEDGSNAEQDSKDESSPILDISVDGERTISISASQGKKRGEEETDDNEGLSSSIVKKQKIEN